MGCLLALATVSCGDETPQAEEGPTDGGLSDGNSPQDAAPQADQDAAPQADQDAAPQVDSGPDAMSDEGGAEPDPDGSFDEPLEAQDDRAVTTRNVPVHIRVLENDRGADSSDLRILSFTDGAHGEVSLRSDGALRYRPDASFDGTDEFSYTVGRADGETQEASVEVRVLPALGTVAAGTLYTALHDPTVRVYYGLNNAGNRIGSTPAGSWDFFVESPQGERTSVVRPEEPEGPGLFFLAGINDDASAVGFFYNASWQVISFQWEEGILTPWGEAELGLQAQGISNAGTVVGIDYDGSDDVERGFVRSQDGELELVEVEDAASTHLWGINNLETGIGMYRPLGEDGPGRPRCFLRDPDGSTRSLPMADWAQGYTDVRCVDLNDEGWAVGDVSLGDSATHAILWSEASGFVRFEFPFAPEPGAKDRKEYLLGINDRGELVGYYVERVAETNDAGELTQRSRSRSASFAPVEAEPHTFYEDTRFGIVASAP